MSTAQETATVRKQVSPEEWQTRVDLAAAYRLVAHYGWDDLIFTHLSARVPGPEHHFLINPYGMMFDEITASSLVKVNLEGKLVMPPAEAFVLMYILESACRIQILAQSGGVPLSLVPQPIVEGVASQMDAVTVGQGAQLAWPGLLRKLDRLDLSYRE